MSGSSRQVTIAGLIIVAVLAVLSTSSGGSKQTGESREVVSRFVDLDADGGRLSGGKPSEQIRSLIGYDGEPGWDTAIVVAKYRIEHVYQARDIAFVAVRYHVLGVAREDFARVADCSEFIVFSLERDSRRWSIVGPLVPPHVSAAAVARHAPNGLARAMVDTPAADTWPVFSCVPGK